MSNEIILALITGGLSLIGVILSNDSANRKIEQKLQTAQAVTDTKIEQLTFEVRKHNNFAQRVPVLEEQVKVANHRIDDLEKNKRRNVYEIHKRNIEKSRQNLPAGCVRISRYTGRCGSCD